MDRRAFLETSLLAAGAAALRPWFTAAADRAMIVTVRTTGREAS
jgi:hypothetical protein